MPPGGPGVDDILARASGIEGLLAVALVDPGAGLVLATAATGGSVDPQLVGAAAADVVDVLADLVARLGADDELEDVMVTMSQRLHLIRAVRPSGSSPLALVATLDRGSATLGLARRDLQEIADALASDARDV